MTIKRSSWLYKLVYEECTCLGVCECPSKTTLYRFVGRILIVIALAIIWYTICVFAALFGYKPDLDSDNGEFIPLFSKKQKWYYFPLCVYMPILMYFYVRLIMHHGIRIIDIAGLPVMSLYYKNHHFSVLFVGMFSYFLLILFAWLISKCFRLLCKMVKKIDWDAYLQRTGKFLRFEIKFE